MHLFFLCPFAKAAWFHKPWFLRTEILMQNVHSVAAAIKSLLWLNHPKVNLTSIATFMWCIWKARNDELFCRKKHKPQQMAVQSNALLNNMETQPVIALQHEQEARPTIERPVSPKFGDSVIWRLGKHRFLFCRTQTVRGRGMEAAAKSDGDHCRPRNLSHIQGTARPH
jgi:hypothetical protein